MSITSENEILIKGISSVGDLQIVPPTGIMVDYLGTKKQYMLVCPHTP